MSKDIHIVQAFSMGARGGNPAAVVLKGQAYTPAQRQALASKLNLSETVFVLPEANTGRRLEFYTPSRQIPHCGHATLAAFAMLAARGKIALGLHSHLAVDGVRRVEIGSSRIMLEQAGAAFSPFARHRAALRALGLPDKAGHDSLPTVIGSTGNRFLLLPLAQPSWLHEITPNFRAIEALSQQHDLVGFYPFAQTQGPVAAATRMFAPAYGIPEEAATGMAAGPLGAYLQSFAGAGKGLLQIAQGAAMHPASPSRIWVDVQPQKVWVGGQAGLKQTITLG